MISIPIWIAILIIVLLSFVFFVTGVLLCYRSTPRIGYLIPAMDNYSGERYLFLELNKPLEQMENVLVDGKEVLAKVRVKNTP